LVNILKKIQNFHTSLTKLLNEGAAENAALDFLSQQIKNSPFRGKIWMAGGGVRDRIMGLDVKDIDLVVELPEGGIKFAEWLTRKLGIYRAGSNPVIYPKFGTAKFNLRGIHHDGVDLTNIDVEVVMTRKEQYHDNSRKPNVSPGTLAQDVERRDFTVNSLLQDLTTGEILDLTGKGIADIKAGVIRTPLNPNVIFREDPLRMLRAIRFAVKYNWKLSMFMIRGLKDNASMLQNISAERIRDELNKMLVSPRPAQAVRLMQITGLSKYVFPELDGLIHMTQNKMHKWDANKHTMAVLQGVPADLKTRLAALFHDIGKGPTRSEHNYILCQKCKQKIEV
jgi:poly(A) polymerase